MVRAYQNCVFDLITYSFCLKTFLCLYCRYFKHYLCTCTLNLTCQISHNLKYSSWRLPPPFSLFCKNHSKGKIELRWPRTVRFYIYFLKRLIFFLSLSSLLSLLTPYLTQRSSPPRTPAPPPRPPAVEPVHVPTVSCTASARERRRNEVRLDHYSVLRAEHAGKYRSIR